MIDFPIKIKKNLWTEHLLHELIVHSHPGLTLSFYEIAIIGGKYVVESVNAEDDSITVLGKFDNLIEAKEFVENNLLVALKKYISELAELV